jgi:carbonic anhydrase
MTPTLHAPWLLLYLSLASASVPILPYDYDPNSPQGPLGWNLVNVNGSEWEKYIGHDHIDLDVTGNECKSTRRPSPTNLIANFECFDTHEILTRQIRNTDCKIDDVTFYTTPHTLRMDFPHDDFACQRPTIDMPNGMPYRWLAHHVEVHLRAEHILEGRRYDGEIQMYHLGQSDQKRELAAVSVLLDASGLEDDAKLQQWIDHWEQAVEREVLNCGNSPSESPSSSPALQLGMQRNLQTAEAFPQEECAFIMSPGDFGTARTALEDVEHMHPRKLQEMEQDIDTSNYAPRRKMWPYDLWPTIYYYGYKGMLTAPPCSEIVNWRILDEPLVISRRQYKTIAKLLSSHVDPETCKPVDKKSPTGENFRPLQKLNNAQQEVKHCVRDDFQFWMYPPEQQ